MGLFSKSAGDEKIKELCGGFICNDAFKARASRFKSIDGLTSVNEKSVLKHEYENGTLGIGDMENRLDELLQLDCATLDTRIRIRKNMDTSQFKTQEDINRFLGDEYARSYEDKLEKNRLKRNAKFEREEGRKLEAIKRYDIFKGVEAYVEYPKSGLRLKYHSLNPSDGTATVRVGDEGIFFKGTWGEILVENDSILSAGDGHEYDVNLNLIFNQIIVLRFNIAGIVLASPDKGYVEEYFMDVVNRQACGDEFEERTLERICPECQMINGINRSFCINCGRQL